MIPFRTTFQLSTPSLSKIFLTKVTWPRSQYWSTMSVV